MFQRQRSGDTRKKISGVGIGLLCTAWLLAGCAPKVVPSTAAEFCLVEEKRKFTQEELDWRAANAPWNLRRDFKTNLAWEEFECDSSEE